MDAQEIVRVNVETFESGTKLMWCEIVPSNDITFQNVIKRIEEMERNGWGLSIQK
jgi:hypothetical protein